MLSSTTRGSRLFGDLDGVILPNRFEFLFFSPLLVCGLPSLSIRPSCCQGRFTLDEGESAFGNVGFHDFCRRGTGLTQQGAHRGICMWSKIKRITAVTMVDVRERQLATAMQYRFDQRQLNGEAGRFRATSRLELNQK